MKTKPDHKDSVISRKLLLLLSLILCLGVVTACTSKRKVAYTPHRQAPNGQIVQLSDSGKVTKALEAHYSHWQGTGYQHGGLSRSGIDCSGFTLLTYRELFGQTLPRITEDQADSGRKVSRSVLRPGDLVFFKTGFFQKHVGIYLEKSSFIHVSSSKGVMISNLNEPYWQKRYWKAQRF